MNIKKIIFAFITLIATISIAYFINIWIGIVFICIIISLYSINRYFKYRIHIVNKDIINFMTDTKRDFDVLIIGKPLKNKPEDLRNKRILTFTHKKRTLFASYLYLIHNFSYLKEDGNGIVYILSDKDENKNHVTIFDLLSYHKVIRMKLKADSSFITRFPIFFYFKKFKNKEFFIEENIPLRNRIKTFCEERNIKVKIINQ